MLIISCDGGHISKFPINIRNLHFVEGNTNSILDNGGGFTEEWLLTVLLFFPPTFGYRIVYHSSIYNL
jgi:hypothetical protein